MTNFSAGPADWTPRTGGDATTVSDVGELDVLAAITPHLAPAHADVGPGDDAAVLPPLPGRTVVTTDSMVCGLDWRDDWSSAHDVGVKVIAQNIADVVAMGATPTGVVVALACESATRLDWLVELTEGMADELRRAGIGALGGDLSGAPDGTVVITVTALGVLAPGREPLRRSGARVGDIVLVSDRLGRSQAGLLVLSGQAKPQCGHDEADAHNEHDGHRRHDEPSDSDHAATADMTVAQAAMAECVAFHRAPRPRYGAGEEAVAFGAHSALDVSDGLSLDAARLAKASGVQLDLSRAALEAMAAPLQRVVGSSVPEGAFDCVLVSGEEHALLATAPSESARAATKAGWRVIGTVREGHGVSLDGEPLPPRGWSHYLR